MKLNIARAMLAIFCLLYTAFAQDEGVNGVYYCRGDWTQRAGHCFKFFRGAENWYSAEEICIAQRIGAHLAIIKAANVQEAVDEIGRRNVNSDEKYWIGAKDDGSGFGYKFSWVDGSPLSYQHYEHWGVGEPNNQGGNEHCMNNDHSKGRDGGMWNDDVCHKPLPFLCSYELRGLQ